MQVNTVKQKMYTYNLLVLRENKISLIYEDDGIGFDSSKNRKGLGLNNIKNRVQLINGTLNIDSKNNRKGTTVIVEVLLDKK
jgi:signal transduction histidine kinase